MKKSESNTKQKVMKLFELKINTDTLMDCKPNEIRDTHEGRYVEYKSEKDSKSSLKGYLEKIRPQLHVMIDDLKKSLEWKMNLTIKPKFMSSTDSNEKQTMCFKSDSSIVMIEIEMKSSKNFLIDTYISIK